MTAVAILLPGIPEEKTVFQLLPAKLHYNFLGQLFRLPNFPCKTSSYNFHVQKFVFQISRAKLRLTTSPCKSLHFKFTKPDFGFQLSQANFIVQVCGAKLRLPTFLSKSCQEKKTIFVKNRPPKWKFFLKLGLKKLWDPNFVKISPQL